MTHGLALPSLVDLTDAPTSRITEAQLEQGYAGPARVEPCACGGQIVAKSTDNIAVVVGNHVGSEPHCSWSSRTGVFLRSETEGDS